jgi:hypothetical protein
VTKYRIVQRAGDPSFYVQEKRWFVWWVRQVRVAPGIGYYSVKRRWDTREEAQAWIDEQKQLATMSKQVAAWQ